MDVLYLLQFNINDLNLYGVIVLVGIVVIIVSFLFFIQPVISVKSITLDFTNVSKKWNFAFLIVGIFLTVVGFILYERDKPDKGEVVDITPIPDLVKKTKYNISGYVYDIFGNPVDNASILINDENSGFETKSKGRFEIRDIEFSKNLNINAQWGDNIQSKVVNIIKADLKSTSETDLVLIDTLIINPIKKMSVFACDTVYSNLLCTPKDKEFEIEKLRIYEEDKPDLKSVWIYLKVEWDKEFQFEDPISFDQVTYFSDGTLLDGSITRVFQPNSKILHRKLPVWRDNNWLVQIKYNGAVLGRYSFSVK